ncbi:MAG: hypothetical protein KGH96_20435 [Sphingomonadales bacterium]|nr:hypothetical protein [Sphingomonadales bacterium]
MLGNPDSAVVKAPKPIALLTGFWGSILAVFLVLHWSKHSSILIIGSLLVPTIVSYGVMSMALFNIVAQRRN